MGVMGLVSAAPSPSTDWQSMAADTTGQNVVASSFTGVYVSNNFGVDWKLALNCSNLEDVSISSSGQVIVGVGSAVSSSECGPIVVSRDFGSSWASSNIANPKRLSIRDATMDGNGEHMAAVSYANGNGQNDAFISVDGGKTFTEVARTDIIYLVSIAMAKSNGKVIMGQELGTLLTSSDFGATFSPVNMMSDNWFTLSCSDSGDVVIAGKGTEVAVSTDGGLNWQEVASLPKGEKYVVHTTASGAMQFAAAGRHSIYKSKDFGATWVDTGFRSLEQTWSALASDASGQYVYAAGTRGRISRSTDYGDTWH